MIQRKLSLVHFSIRSQISDDNHTVNRFVLAGKRRAIYRFQYISAGYTAGKFCYKTCRYLDVPVDSSTWQSE
jgi:hypothetical protein